MIWKSKPGCGEALKLAVRPHCQSSTENHKMSCFSWCFQQNLVESFDIIKALFVFKEQCQGLILDGLELTSPREIFAAPRKSFPYLSSSNNTTNNDDAVMSSNDIPMKVKVSFWKRAELWEYKLWPVDWIFSYKLRVVCLVRDSRLLPPRVTERVLGRDDVDFAERVGEAGRVHRRQVAGPQKRAEQRILRLIVINGHLQPSEDDWLAVICGARYKALNKLSSNPRRPRRNLILINLVQGHSVEWQNVDGVKKSKGRNFNKEKDEILTEKNEISEPKRRPCKMSTGEKDEMSTRRNVDKIKYRKIQKLKIICQFDWSSRIV